jgi:ferredoxin
VGAERAATIEGPTALVRPAGTVEPMARRGSRTVLRINPITCDGHGLCAELLPELFVLDDWGYPMPITVEVPPELEKNANRAAAACPTLAIILDKQRRRD